MVNALLLREARDGWNTIDPAVQAWQKSRGLKVDGLFGPKSALAVAEEFGTVPIIRSWPKGSQKVSALQNYRASLLEIANHATDLTRAAQLRETVKREQAQSFGVKSGKALALPSNLQVTLAKVA
jgi:peptidoglycan hydrolase-like protein with peptidoglycan-binding domain